MSPEIVVGWLSKNDKYAKAIVGLAGIRLSPVVHGVPICVEALWDFPEFQAPIVYSVPMEKGTMFWSGDTTHSALFRKTLGLLTETFASLSLPRRVVVFSGEINLDTKNLHFRAFDFGKSHVVPAKELVILNQTVTDLSEIQKIFEEFTKLSKKLKGIGLGN